MENVSGSISMIVTCILGLVDILHMHSETYIQHNL